MNLINRYNYHEKHPAITRMLGAIGAVFIVAMALSRRPAFVENLAYMYTAIAVAWHVFPWLSSAFDQLVGIIP